MQPQLLPQGSSLLLAVSGGQDSMALLALLQDLAPLHGWSLSLWHGDSAGVVVPAVITVPKTQAPAMQGRQILQ